MDYNVDDTIQGIGQLNFCGNIIPHSWYRHVTFTNGKPDLLGMMILAEIIYWYRPTTIREEHTGNLRGYQKKFKADMLQRSLQSFAKQFGVSRRQVSDALKRLEDHGFIMRELRHIDSPLGKLGNVLFLAPIVANIARIQTRSPIISTPENSGGGNDDYFIPITRLSEPVSPPSCNTLHEDQQTNVAGQAVERSTYTKNTTQITTETAAAPTHVSQSFTASTAITHVAAAEKKQEEVVNLPNTSLLPDHQLMQSHIGTALTHEQLATVQHHASLLFKITNQSCSQLATEITHALLDPTSFSQAGSHFHKKLNTICKCIRLGKWTSTSPSITVKSPPLDVTARNLNLQWRHLAGEVSHWKTLLDIASNKHSPNSKHIASLRDILKNSQTALHTFYQQNKSSLEN